MSSCLSGENKIYYGWVIVLASVIIAMTLLGIRFSFGVFFKSLEAEFEVSRAAISSIFSVYMVFSAFFTVVSGWALDKYGPRVIICLMGLITGLSLLLVSQTNAMWSLFLSYSLLLAIGTGGIYIVLMSAVSRWFDRKRGVALGIAGSGGALGAAVVAPLATHLIANLGWRTSYAILGLVGGCVVLSLATLLKGDPREIGLLPDGIRSAIHTPDLGEEKPDRRSADFSLAEAFRLRSYWLLLLTWLMFAFSATLVLTHLVPHMTDMGVTAGRAAMVLSIICGSNITARFFMGWATDRVGRKVPGIICAVIQAVAVLGLIWARQLWAVYPCAVLFGFSWGGLGIISTALITDFFGGRSIGIIMGTLDIGFVVGAAIGPTLGGFIYDLTGSYSGAFILVALAVLVEALLIGLLRKEHNP